MIPRLRIIGVLELDDMRRILTWQFKKCIYQEQNLVTAMVGMR